jgi:hypothetical protein
VRLTVVVRVRAPLTPVTVIVAAPIVAVLDAERVRRLLPPVAGLGLKLAVTPDGNPLAVKETPAVKPPVRVIVIVLVPLAPRLIVKLAGFTESVKSGVGTSLTVRLNAMVRVRLPPAPDTFNVTAPRAAVLDAETVITELPPVAGFGLKPTVTPVGAAPAVNVTPAVKPPVRVIVIVLVPLAPRATFRLVGEADNAKSGVCGWVMFTLIVAVRVRLPPVPVIVTVAGPSVAVLDAASVRTRLSPVVGAMLADTPVGDPLTLRSTAPVKPPLRVIVTVLVPLAPRLIVRLAGEAESAKSGAAGPGSAPKTLVAPAYTEMFGALTGVPPGVVVIPWNEWSLVVLHAPELLIRN